MTLLLLFAALAFFDAAPDPWTAKEIVQPKTLADRLQAKEQLPIFYVGFPTLYRNGSHIAAATLAGPCSKAEGLDALKKAVAELPRDKEIFIYCGCCPFVKCPNIRPAYSALHDLGFTNVKVVMIETNLHADWIAKGYPSEKTPQ
jgi:thiosulfate/3-mercaptopyruvate sulfurtransferase